MPKLTLSFNEDTTCTQIENLSGFDIKKSNLILEIIKCYNPDDELDDVLEFDVDKKECKVSNLSFKETGTDNCYEIHFDAEITIDQSKWDNVKDKFKKYAVNREIFVDFYLEKDNQEFYSEEDFEKTSDGITTMFLD